MVLIYLQKKEKVGISRMVSYVWKPKRRPGNRWKDQVENHIQEFNWKKKIPEKK